MADKQPKQVDLDGGASDKQYVLGNPITIQLDENDKITFCPVNSAFSIVIDGNDGLFNPSQIWSKFIPAGERMTTPEIRVVDHKEYSVFCVANGDYHGEKQGIGGTDSPPKIIIIE